MYKYQAGLAAPVELKPLNGEHHIYAPVNFKISGKQGTLNVWNLTRVKLRCWHINPFLPSLVTAVLVCWPEAAARQPQKTDHLNAKGYNLEHNVFKFRKQKKNWTVVSVMLILNLLSSCFLIDHVTLFKHLFWSHMDIKHCFEPFSYLYLVYFLKNLH